MIIKWKNAIAAALMTAGLAAPAFAQSSDHTGSQMPHYFDSNGAEIFGSWGPATVVARSRHPVAPRSGLSAFARVPLGASGGASGSYGLGTGGGSIGYNENLRTDQW